MRKYLILFTVLLLAKFASTQVVTSFVVNPMPTAILSEWYNDRTVLSYVTIVQGGATIPVIIKAELKTTDGTVVAKTDLSKATVYTLGPGTRVFLAGEVFPLHNLIFSSSFRNTLEKTGKLPSGTYQLTVQLVRPNTFEILSQPITRIFTLAALQLPVLVSPYNNEKLKKEKAQTAITFRWTPVVPRPTELPFYRLQAFEILEDQTPVQALRANQPLLDIMLRGQTQYIWRPMISFLEDSTDKRFIWTIQSLNSVGEPLIKTDGNGESRSEPFQFKIETIKTSMIKGLKN